MKEKIRNLRQRAIICQLTRNFFSNQGYLEVDTPVHGPEIIPEAHIDLLTIPGNGLRDSFFQASPELYMKRLLVRSNSIEELEKIFQICKCFRKGERSATHLPEMTILEWYAVNQTYLDLMDQCQKLLRHIAIGVKSSLFLSYRGSVINLENGFERITVRDAFQKYAHLSLERALETRQFDEIMGFEIEPQLGFFRPCILYDYPACFASLASIKKEDPKVAERFELYIAGIELANGFTELSDAESQKIRFLEENMIRQKRGMLPLPLPEKFIKDLEKMPNAAGIALGMDRLIMLFCNATLIDQVVAFSPEE